MALTLWIVAASAHAGVVYDQPHNGTGTILQSSWLDPDGYDGDYYIYDNFTLAADTDVTEVRWRGGYKFGAMWGKPFRFTIFFFVTKATVNEPLCGNPHYEDNIYLAKYTVNGLANETFVGNFGGTDMYDYSATLPQALHLTGGVKYWVRVLACHPSVPDWGYARGIGPDTSHFYFNAGAARFGFGTGDCAVTLVGNQTQTVAPSSVSLSIGRNTAGSVADLAVADGVDYVACKFIVPSLFAPFVNLELNGTTTLPDLSTYSLGVRAHMLHSGAFQIGLDAYNFVTSAYDGLVTVPISTSYATTLLTATAPGDHVGAAGAVKSRVRIWQVGPSAVTAPCVGLDQAVWTLQN